MLASLSKTESVRETVDKLAAIAPVYRLEYNEIAFPIKYLFLQSDALHFLRRLWINVIFDRTVW